MNKRSRSEAGVLAALEDGNWSAVVKEVLETWDVGGLHIVLDFVMKQGYWHVLSCGDCCFLNDFPVVEWLQKHADDDEPHVYEFVGALFDVPSPLQLFNAVIPRIKILKKGYSQLVDLLWSRVCLPKIRSGEWNAIEMHFSATLLESISLWRCLCRSGMYDEHLILRDFHEIRNAKLCREVLRFQSVQTDLDSLLVLRSENLFAHGVLIEAGASIDGLLQRGVCHPLTLYGAMHFHPELNLKLLWKGALFHGEAKFLVRLLVDNNVVVTDGDLQCLKTSSFENQFLAAFFSFGLITKLPLGAYNPSDFCWRVHTHKFCSAAVRARAVTALKCFKFVCPRLPRDLRHLLLVRAMAKYWYDDPHSEPPFFNPDVSHEILREL
jgi:hypothetical protein